MKIYEGIENLIGNTPLLRLKNIEKTFNLKAKIIAKLEYLNPAGSVKDRAAKFMLDDAVKKGLITEGATIIEPTSGNTGIGLAALGASRGYKVVLTMPNSMSIERVNLLKAYGAKVVLTDGSLGMRGAIDKAEEIKKSTPNSIIIGQFNNPSNPLAHYFTTGQEIWKDTDGQIDLFIAGIGTGGTIFGTGKFLKEQNPKVVVLGVEPESSPLITKGRFGAHKIQGIGANFIPQNFEQKYCDKVVAVSDENAFDCARIIAKSEGILVGISSGAVLSAAIEQAKSGEYDNKTIVVLLPDTGDRYLSTELFN